MRQFTRASDIAPIRFRSVEISAADHCNLKCAGCNHASPHLPARMSHVETIERDLSALRGVIFADELRIAGGEPTLNPRLNEILSVARASAVAQKLTLITNGMHIDSLSPDSWKLIDRLWLSRYPGVRLRWDIETIAAECKKYGVELHLTDNPEFGLTLLNDRIESDALVKFVYKNCALARDWSCHLVYEGHFYKCTPAAFIPRRLELAGRAASFSGTDALPLHDSPDLRGRLVEYLNASQPLEACRYCLGSMGKSISHHQMNRSKRASELTASHEKPLALLGARGVFYSTVTRKVTKMLRRHTIAGADELPENLVKKGDSAC